MATGTKGWAYQSAAFGTTSPVTGSAPTLATDGQDITSLQSITILVEAPASQTLSGAGSLQAYVYFPQAIFGTTTPIGWVRMPAADIAVTASGMQRFAFTPYNVVAPVMGGRLAYVPVGVTFNGGSSGVVVYQFGTGSPIPRRYT